MIIIILLILVILPLLCISFLNVPQFHHIQKVHSHCHIVFKNYGTKDSISNNLFKITYDTNKNDNCIVPSKEEVKVDEDDDNKNIILHYDEEPSLMDYNTKMKLVKSVIDADTSLLEELIPILVNNKEDIKILIKALSGCRSKSDWRTAFSLYQYSKKLLLMRVFRKEKEENNDYETTAFTSSTIDRIPPIIYGQCLVALARGGAEVQVYQVLCEMLESGVAPNLITIDNIILELSSRGAYKIIIEMIEQLTRFRLESAISNVALNALLNACNRVKAYDYVISSYQRYIAEREINHIILDKIGFSVLLKACDRIEDAITPIEAFYRIVRYSPNGLKGVDHIINESSLQRMIAICLKTNSRDIAMELILRIEKDDWSIWSEEPHFTGMFQQLILHQETNKDLRADSRLYSAMITILSRENYTIDNAYELFEFYRDNNGKLDESMFTSLIFAQRIKGDYNTANKIFEELLAYEDAGVRETKSVHGTNILSVASCNALLSVYSECNIDKNGNINSELRERSDELFDVMKARNIRWNSQTYYALMLGYHNDSNNVIELWQQMKTQQIGEGSSILNKAVVMETLKACVKEGNGRIVLDILQDVRLAHRSNNKSQGILPDMPMYVLGLNAIQNDQQGRSNQTMQLLDMMKESGLKPNLKVYNIVFSILQKALDWRNSMGMLFQMFRGGQKVNPKIFNSVLITCSKSQQWDLVLKLFNEISTIHSPDTMRLFDMTSVSCSIHASTKLGDSNATRSLLQQALLLNETISSSALRYAATIFDKENLRSDSEWLFENFVGGHLDPWTVDLHGYSSSVAKGAVLSALKLIKDEIHETGIANNMIIITGRGKHSGGSKSLLKPVLQLWLRTCFDPPLQAAELSENPGRLIVSKELLHLWSQQNFQTE